MYTRLKIALTGCVVAAVSLVACDKEAEPHSFATLKGRENMAFVKLVHVAPNFRNVVSQPGIITRDSFNLFISSAKINSGGAGTSGFMTYGGQFPAQTTGYVGVTPGLHWFRLSLNGRNTADSATLHSFQKVLEPGQKYSYIITDSVTSKNENRQMFLLDNFNTPVPGNYGVRFVHTVWNDTAGKTVDVYSFRRKANIFSNVKIGEATGFLEYGPSGNDTLSIRRSGTAWELTRLNAIPFTSGRVYTVIYRGFTSPLTSNPRPRGAIYYLNN